VARTGRLLLWEKPARGLGALIIGKLPWSSLGRDYSEYAHVDNDPVRKASEHIIAGRLAADVGENISGASEMVTDINDAKGSKNRRG